MTNIALTVMVGAAYFCGMVDVSHRHRTPFGLVFTILLSAVLYHQYGEGI